MESCGLVVLNYIGYETSGRLIDAVKDFSELEHIVIVDNKSPNDSYERLRKYECGKISVIQSERNGGYSYGNNFGIKYLIENYHPDIIGIANPDVIFDNGLVKRIKEIFASHNDYAVLSGIQFDTQGKIGGHPFWDNDREPVSMCMQAVSELLPFSSSRRRKRIRAYRNYIDGVVNSKTELNSVWAVEGSLFFIRTEDFEAAGMFDENVFMYYEENILACKLHKLGKKVGIINTATYIHAHIHADMPKNAGNTESKKTLNGLENPFRKKLFYASKAYYFRHYVSDSKTVYVFYLLLEKLCRLKEAIKLSGKKLHKKIFHCLKRQPVKII